MTDNRTQSRIHSYAFIVSGRLVGYRHALPQRIERVERRCRIVVVSSVYGGRSVYNVSVSGRCYEYAFAKCARKLEYNRMNVLPFSIVEYEIISSSIRGIVMFRTRLVVDLCAVCARAVYNVFCGKFTFVGFTIYSSFSFATD